MEPSTRLVTVVRMRSCTFRVILEKPSQWYEQTMEDSPLPSVTNMDTQIGLSTACHQEPPEYCKPSKCTTSLPKDPGDQTTTLNQAFETFWTLDSRPSLWCDSWIFQRPFSLSFQLFSFFLENYIWPKNSELCFLKKWVPLCEKTHKLSWQIQRIFWRLKAWNMTLITKVKGSSREPHPKHVQTPK